MKLSPVTVRLGSEVSGIDLNTATSSKLDDIYEALIDRGVLVFRDQALSPLGHVALGTSFGNLAQRHPLYPAVDGHADIISVRNDENNPPENEVWHSDLSCSNDPPFVSILRAALIPPVGGDTLWADLRSVHDALPVSVRARLEELDALHTLAHGFRFLDTFAKQANQESNSTSDPSVQQSRLATLTNTDDPGIAASVHPVVMCHPANQRRIVYVNESFTKQILGVSDAESDALLAEVFREVRNPRHQMRLRWTPETVVMWDNWSTQHFACGDHYPAHREVQRVTVATNRRSHRFSEATASRT
jgi:taurine dioxygenase